MSLLTSRSRPASVRTSSGLIVPETKMRLLRRNVRAGKHTLLTGPTGCGKTTLARDVAAMENRPCEVFHCGGMFDGEASVTGTTQLENGNTRFVPSRFIEAMTTAGCVLVADELNRAPVAVVNAFLSVLDWQGRIAVDTDGGARRTVELAPGVVVIATANVGAEYVQTEPLDAALMNRFLQVRLRFPEDERQLLEELGLSQGDAARLVKIAREVRAAYARGDLPATVTTRTLLAAGELVKNQFSIEESFESATPVIDDADVVKLRALVRGAA